ncbi:MAG: thioredoxin domain-containing protein [Akkermansiaceae bacterium]|nr:thioredoxin domain-containing protein [Akkermansiaceae bacterium]
MSKPAHSNLVVKRAVAMLLIVAFSLSLWLTIRKLTGEIDSLAGCGAGSGCANVLGSRWSMVFGTIPVSVFSCLLYAAVFVSLWLAGAKARWLRMFAAWILIGAAVWFTALQVFVLHAICPYCMTMHGLGVLIGSLVLFLEFKASGVARMALGSLGGAAVSVMGLVAVQYFGPVPETHRVDDVTVDIPETGGAVVDSIHTAGEGRLVSFFDGRKSYRVDALPHLGSGDAEHVIVKYFDYTCEACRDVHVSLEKIMAKYPGRLAVVVLAVPLDNKCNPNLPLGVESHRNACEFARLSLRVWRADPSKFAEFHAWLFEYHTQPYEAAEAMAYSLVGAEKMEAVDTGWVDAVLKENMADYKIFVRETPVMPKVLIGGSKIMQGVAKDTGTFELLLKQNLGL